MDMDVRKISEKFINKTKMVEIPKRISALWEIKWSTLGTIIWLKGPLLAAIISGGENERDFNGKS